MHLLLSGGTINPLHESYGLQAARAGFTYHVCYPGELLALDRFDALLLTGGADIAPERFGAARLPNETETIDERRDEMELWLFGEFVRRGLPILGICRGLQLINVALGGDLWQDLPSQCALRHNASGPLWHEVVWQDERREMVNSFHHQGLRRLGDGLVAVAAAPDGLTEAVTHSQKPIRAVQWHPERLRDGMGWLWEGLH